MANYAPLRQRTVAGNGTIDLNHARTFVRVVEDGSFTAAARHLGLPKSSVSRSVTALEHELGVRLLQRTTRSLQLTDAGRTWFQQVRPALASVADSAASVQALGTEPRGRVRVSVPPDTYDFITRYVARFKKRHPQVQLDISFNSRQVDLVAEGFDLALRCGEMKDSSLVVRRIHQTDLALFASAAYLRRKGTPKKLADLMRHECIVMNAPSGSVVWSLTGPDGQVEAVEVPASIATDLPQFAVRAAASGLGIALLPEAFSGGDAELHRVLPQYRRAGGALCIVSPSRGFEPRAVTLFKEGLIEALTRLDVQQCQRGAR